MSENKEKIQVKGKPVDDQTRCVHYNSPLDVIALKFKCCKDYYPCFQCHEETAGHPAEVWSKGEKNQRAVLCGVCQNELTIDQYLQSGNHCPFCQAAFNPGCSRHYHLYFEI